jgi:hypothetical protein
MNDVGHASDYAVRVSKFKLAASSCSLCDIWAFSRSANLLRRLAPAIRSPFSRVRSSAEEHYLDMVGVTGSIPVAPTIAFLPAACS